MKSNQSLHVTVKEPPNNQPVKTLGIFSNVPDTALIPIIQGYLSGIDAAPKDAEFLQNVREEVIKVILTSEILTVARFDGLLQITLRESTK